MSTGSSGPRKVTLKRAGGRPSAHQQPAPPMSSPMNEAPYGGAPQQAVYMDQGPSGGQAGGYPDPGGFNPAQAAMAGMAQQMVQNPQQMMQTPMANMAMQYGGQFAEQGKDYMQQNIEKYVAASRIKYYFAVDTSYVVKKLGLLMFPYIHTDWAVSYNRDHQPVQPRHDVNAPDLYIPVMGFVTYVIVSAIALGIQNRFTPETIGIQASSALGYLALEILLLLLVLYVMSIGSTLGYLDLAAFCGYKYFGMILVLMAGLVFGSMGYYATLGWTCAALAFFLVRSLKVQMLGDADAAGGAPNQDRASGSKRRLYLLLSMACVQPVFMWWLTLGLV